MKRSALVTFLIICILATSHVAVFAYDNSSSDTSGLFVVHAEIDGTVINSSNINGEYYLFLPASADLTNLVLSFESNKYDMSSISLWGSKGGIKPTEYTDITAITKLENDDFYELRVVTSEGAQFYFYILKGANIATVYLTSGDLEKNREWVDASKANKATGTMLMTDKNGSVIYDGELTQIKGRGNTTFDYFPKKPYQIKLNEKTDLLDKGEKEKTWVLLANYIDASLMHDKLMKDLAREIGMPYTPDCDWVNLYYDGEYRGVYLLSEKVSIGSAGVDITDMEDAYSEINENYGDDALISTGINKYGQIIQYAENLNELDNYTGGYLIELNRDEYDEASGFITVKNKGFNIKSPEFLGKAAATYISEYYQEFEDAVFATDAAIGYTGYNDKTEKYFYEYVDFTSIIKSFMLQEFANNPDAYYASTFFYKDAEGIMYQGPIWDQDMTFGHGWKLYVSPYWEMGDYIEEVLLEIDVIENGARDYYDEYLKNALYSLVEDGGLIDQYEMMLDDNAKMNYIIWPFNRNSGSEHEERVWHGYVDYNKVVDDLKWYIKERLSIIDERYEKDTVTRATFINEFARIAGQDITYAEGENWYEPGIDWAISNDITDGTRMHSDITREQIATMLYRYAGEPETKDNLKVFADGDKVSAWAEDAMSWAVREGIYKGYSSGELKPQNLATAKEVEIVLKNYTEKF